MSFDDQLKLSLLVSMLLAISGALFERNRRMKSNKELNQVVLVARYAFMVILPIMSLPILISKEIELYVKFLIILGMACVCLSNLGFYWVFHGNSNKNKNHKN